MALQQDGRKRARLAEHEADLEGTVEDFNPVVSKAQFLDLGVKAFLSNVVYLLAIQDDDKIFKQTFDEAFAKDDQETINGVPSKLEQFLNFLENFRETVSDRFLLNQQFLVVPTGHGNSSNAHSFQIIGFQQEGKRKVKVVGTFVAVVTLKPVKGKLQVVLESFVNKTDEL